MSALYNLLDDPMEKKNLLSSSDPEDAKALKKFRAIVEATPEKDARPQYRHRDK